MTIHTGKWIFLTQDDFDTILVKSKQIDEEAEARNVDWLLTDVLKVIEETLSKLAVKFRKTSPS